MSDELNTEIVSDDPVSVVADPASPVESDQQKQEKRDKVQERINKLIYEKGQLEAENRLLKERGKSVEDTKQAPTLAESNYDDAAYAKAMQGYYESLMEAKAEAAALRLMERREAEAKSKQRDETFNSRFSKLSADEQETAKTALVTDVMADIIKDSDVGEKVLLHLAANPELSEMICRLPERQQAKEMGKLEAVLSAKPVVEKVVSKAPPPPAKLDAVDAGTNEKPDSEMSDDEWFKKNLGKSKRKK
jgi:hypothetical protein